MKIKYIGRETHIVLQVANSYLKFKQNESKEVAEAIAQQVLKSNDFCIDANEIVEIEKVEQAKVMPALKRRGKKE